MDDIYHGLPFCDETPSPAPTVAGGGMDVGRYPLGGPNLSREIISLRVLGTEMTNTIPIALFSGTK